LLIANKWASLDHAFSPFISFYRFHPQMSAHSSYAWRSSLIWSPIFLRDFLHLLHSLCLQMNLFIAIHARPYDIWVGCLPIWMVSKDHIWEHTLPLDVFKSESYPPQRGGFFCLQGKLFHYTESRPSILQWPIVQIFKAGWVICVNASSHYWTCWNHVHLRVEKALCGVIEDWLDEHCQLQERACK